MNKTLPILITLFAVAGCGTQLPFMPAKGEPEAKPAPAPAPAPVVLSRGQERLAKGIKQYYAGDYKAAAILLHEAFKLGLKEQVDQVTAHKFLAFGYCRTKRQPLCRGEFRKALSINPGFELEPAEADNPQFGPAFRKAKKARKN
jgi:Tfp pilus assembly protein PilF